MWQVSWCFAKMSFFASPSQAVAVADRYPQNVFAEHTHEFLRAGAGVARQRSAYPQRSPVADYPRRSLFIFARKINTLMRRSTTRCCRILFIARIGCGSILTGRRIFRDYSARRGSRTGGSAAAGWRRSGRVINQLEHESARQDAQADSMAELLFAQLVLTLQRYRYATDNPAATQKRNTAR